MIHYGFEPPWRGEFVFDTEGHSFPGLITMLDPGRRMSAFWERQGEALWDGSGYAWKLCTSDMTVFESMLRRLSVGRKYATKVRWMEDDFLPRLTHAKITNITED